MSNLLFFDTETTGFKPRYVCNPKSLQAIDKANWRMVSVAWIICSPEVTLSEDKSLILKKPDLVQRYFVLKADFNIPLDATSVHGINREVCDKDGVSLDIVMDTLAKDMVDHDVDTLVAHYNDFHRIMLLSEIYRARNFSLFNELNGIKRVCTSDMYRNWKSCGYSSADLRLFNIFRLLNKGEPFNHNHALEDAKAVQDIYIKMIALKSYEEYDATKPDVVVVMDVVEVVADENGEVNVVNDDK